MNKYSLRYNENGVFLDYTSSDDMKWLYEKFKPLNIEESSLEEPPHTILNKMFYLTESDLYDIDEHNAVFKIGDFDGEYYQFDKKICRLKFSFKIKKGFEMELKLLEGTFGSPNINMIAEIANKDVTIGNGENEISLDTLKRAHDAYPTRSEINKYARSRIANVLSSELNLKKDYDSIFEKYLEKKTGPYKHKFLDKRPMELEIEKLEYQREKFNQMLNDETLTEDDWHGEIFGIFRILYPQYISMFHEEKLIPLFDHDKRSDFLLINNLGYVDLIEVKKPNAQVIGNLDRNNYVITKPASNAIVQIENYLYALNRWGEEGEKKLTVKFKDKLPEDLTVKISNPNGFLIMGRCEGLDYKQIHALQLIRRQYSHIVDIITYDDMLYRIDVILKSLRKTVDDLD